MQEPVELESIKQSKNEITIFMSEEGTERIDGTKVFSICSHHGRMVGLGMDGTRLKITIQINRIHVDDWLNIAKEIMRELEGAKK